MCALQMFIFGLLDYTNYNITFGWTYYTHYLWYTTSLHRCVHATLADHMPQSPYPCITASVPQDRFTSPLSRWHRSSL